MDLETAAKPQTHLKSGIFKLLLKGQQIRRICSLLDKIKRKAAALWNWIRLKTSSSCNEAW